MGIGFGATAKLTGTDGKPLSRAAAFAMIRKAIEDSCDDPFLASLIQFGEQEHELAVILHPASEALFFTWDPAGTIFASAKTSICGPGYHAYAVDVVRAVGQHCRLEWSWEDETDYAVKGGFARLQDQMAEFLTAMADSFLREDKLPLDRPWAVNMALDPPLPVRGGPFSITPLGPRSRSFWESLLRPEGARKAAPEFYHWWNRERDASFYRNTGLGLLWTDISWHPPLDEAQEAVMRLTIDCFERAEELAPTVQLPQAELQELRHLLDMEDESEIPIPAPNLIGYFRAVINRRLPGPWSVELPGYWPMELDGESETPVFWHNNRSFRAATYQIDAEPGKPMPTPDQLAVYDNEDVPSDAERFEFRKDGIVARGAIWQDEEEGEKFTVLQGHIGAKGSAALITITFVDPADRDWALKTIKAVTFSADEAQGD